jgi:hypothetical protein
MKAGTQTDEAAGTEDIPFALSTRLIRIVAAFRNTLHGFLHAGWSREANKCWPEYRADKLTGPEAILSAIFVRTVREKSNPSRITPGRPAKRSKPLPLSGKFLHVGLISLKHSGTMAGIPSQPAKRSSSFLGRRFGPFIESLKSQGMKATNPGRRIDRGRKHFWWRIMPGPGQFAKIKKTFQVYFRRPIEEGRFHWPPKFRADDRPDLMFFCLPILSGLFAKNPNPGTFCGPSGQSKQTTSIDRRCQPFLRSLKPVIAISVGLPTR